MYACSSMLSVNDHFITCALTVSDILVFKVHACNLRTNSKFNIVISS